MAGRSRLTTINTVRRDRIGYCVTTRAHNLEKIVKYDFNVLERRAQEFSQAGEFQNAMAIYLYMGDGDPSLDAGYLGFQIGACFEALGDLHQAKWWYGRAVEENPEIPQYREARKRLDHVNIDDLVNPKP
jgi:tetratricopeptide (TPR) repeat protein